MRESPAGSGGPEVGHWREVPGEDIEVREGVFPDKKRNTSKESVDMDTCKGLEREEKQMSKTGEQYRHEDELDPRIQVSNYIPNVIEHIHLNRYLENSRR